MLDFVSIKYKKIKGTMIVYPEFKVKRSKDLMIRGRSFYAIWNEETNFWTTDEYEVQRLVDKMTFEFVDKHPFDCPVEMKLMVDMSSNMWTEWLKYCKSLGDSYHELDNKITFANDEMKKTDYISKCLPYGFVKQDTPAYNELMSTLYDEEEREKLEWAVGSIISGDSKKLQKFIVLYGDPGSGKSTFLNIVQMLFQGYYETFDSRALTKVSNAFALEAFRSNPLIAIEHDGDLSRIEDNTKLNSIVSHEEMTINEKFKATYMSKFKSFLFMGTNKPVKITDAKSGILRRLIDVQPSGKKVPRKRFEELINQIRFELGGIADRCYRRYEEMGISYYDDYIPISMFGATNDFFNFVEDNYDFFIEGSEEGISLSVAWKRYQEYCDDAKVPYPMHKRLFKDEMKNYFERFEERDQNRRSVFFGFKREKLDYVPLDGKKKKKKKTECWLNFNNTESLLDKVLEDYPAQYSVGERGTPGSKWDKCKTKLKDLDTTKEHYVLGPLNLITIDFDLKDEKGEKSYERNVEAASKWPRTYAEISKSGAGIHLHYWYEGEAAKISRVYSEGIEIKIFTGSSSLRRRVSKANSVEISTISSGLPLKEVKTVVKEETIKSERGLRELIKKNLRKEVHEFTKPSIDFIYRILEDAHEQGLKYDVRDMRPAVQNFALSSSNNADYCLKMVSKMKFNSDEPSNDEGGYKEDAPIIFYDVEVFPNLFVVVWKQAGPDHVVVKWINPQPERIEELVKNRLVGFNNRKYDNHILYARMMGYNEKQLFKLSQRIVVDKDQNALFGEAYNLSYTDIYDFLSSGNKMSLKKWEIKLGIHHHELGYKWDEEVPEEKWGEVAEYCVNDVLATEATWLANQEDWLAREVLSEWAELTPNDTTNNCTTRIIVGKDRDPNSQFIYTDLGTIFPGYRYDQYGIPADDYITGTKIVSGKSIYRGEDPGEGGYVYACPGIYNNVAVLDVASMHPHSAIRLNIFGDTYTGRFKDIVEARIAIKHKDYEKAKKIIPERLHRYLDDPKGAKKLANALKTAINSVYGLTSASFPNKLKDPRNVDNIVAKYGALFMINLKHEVQNKGFIVVHIKTDSIKIANATPEIIEFVHEYGRQYGYTFEHESTYGKICLVNDAVYIAQYASKEKCMSLYNYIPENNEEHPLGWTATGTQFAVPYVFKTLFSKEQIVFEDLCETKSVSTALYLDFNEHLPEGEHDYKFVGKVGAFCPMIDGVGAGILLREGNDKFSAATGTKKPGKGNDVYKWMEAEMVLKLRYQDKIDKSYYNKLVDDAIETISKYGDFERFVSDTDEYQPWEIPPGLPEEIPFDDYLKMVA